MQVEVYALTDEGHAFHPEAQPLLSRRTPRQFDFAARTEYALPGKLAWDHRFQKARDGPMIAGVSCGGGHLAVACPFPSGDGTDGLYKCLVLNCGSNPPNTIHVQNQSLR